MANSLNYKIGIDNIFDFSFMDDFTTVILAKEEYNIDISTLNYQNEDDFYSFIENKIYKFISTQIIKRFINIFKTLL